MGAAHQRYGGLSAAGKKALVDELVVITGYHRKSVLRALDRWPISVDGDDITAEPHRHHRCRYGPEVMEALVPLWEASDRLCGKRLQALLPLLLESLERHGHLVLDPEVREKLLTISSATIDRLLAPVRKMSPGNGWRRPPRARSAVQRRTPVRTFNGWGEVKEAGWLEIDLVAHCGKWMEGRFLWTLVATDMATGWSECLPLLNRDGASVMAALRMLEELLPFPLRGIDVDNDGAFLNAPLEQWCEKHQPRIELTRSRAYQSNDQAWVEQKNGMLVRRVVGYERLEGLVAAELLGGSSTGPYGYSPTSTSPCSSSRRRSARAPSSSGGTILPVHHKNGCWRLASSGMPSGRRWRICSAVAIRWPCWKRCVAARLPWPASRPGKKTKSKDPGQGRWILSRQARSSARSTGS